MSDIESMINRHIHMVAERMKAVVRNLQLRSEKHDNSKFSDIELQTIKKWKPVLDSVEYGSKDYKDALAGMGEGLAHHYKNNSHHPEHYEKGVSQMSLMDLIEMLCDWRAAHLHRGGTDFQFYESIQDNCKRFRIDTQTESILMATAEELDFITFESWQVHRTSK